jgi:hypothetical protein
MKDPRIKALACINFLSASCLPFVKHTWTNITGMFVTLAVQSRKRWENQFNWVNLDGRRLLGSSGGYILSSYHVQTRATLVNTTSCTSIPYSNLSFPGNHKSVNNSPTFRISIYKITDRDIKWLLFYTHFAINHTHK